MNHKTPDTATGKRRKREGAYCCGKCGTAHQRAGFHDDDTYVTPADRPELTRAILAWYAGQDSHAQMMGRAFTAAVFPDAVVPLDARTRAGRTVMEADLEHHFLQLDLVDAGLLTVVNEPTADGNWGWGFLITAEGRTQLAGGDR